MQREIECPKRFNLTPSMKTLLKRNVTTCADGIRQTQSSCKIILKLVLVLCHLPSGSKPGFDGRVGKSDESQNLKKQEVVNSVLRKFRDLHLDENSDQVHGQMDQKNEMILNLTHQIKDLERQVKERKDWAHQNAMRAARKLSNDLTELNMLWMEREETQRLKKGKTSIKDTTAKSLKHMETALRKASGQVEHANLTVKKLENKNAEIRAEMETCKPAI